MTGKDRWRYQGKMFSGRWALARHIMGEHATIEDVTTNGGMFCIWRDTKQKMGRGISFTRSYTTDGLGVHNLREGSNELDRN